MNLDQPIVQLDGSPVFSDEQKKTELTLATVCAGALSNPVEEDSKSTPDKAVERWRLAVKVHGGGEQDLTVEQVTTIRTRLVKLYGPLIAGQACALLDPPAAA